MKSITTEKLNEICDGMTALNFEKRTEGLPLVIKSILAARLALLKVADYEAAAAETKADALIRILKNG